MTNPDFPGVPVPPFRHAFDAARSPLAARNALGITSTGGGGSGFITAVTPPLQVTGTTLSIDLSAYLTSATAAATYQPLDGDLTAIAALSGTNTIYYRSGASTWSAVTVSTGLSFSGGVLTATGGGGTPGGSNTQVQFNDSSAFGGDADLTWNKTTNVLTVTGQIAIALGNATSIDAVGVVQTGGGFKQTGVIAVLGPASAGIVQLRPNGITSSTGQFLVNSSGTITVNGTIELGAATDTTLSRVSAGVVAIEGQNILTVATGAPIGSEYITSTADATLTNERVLTDTATVTWDRTTAGQIKANATGGGGTTVLPGPPQGRLTLSSTQAVMTSTAAGATLLYYLPYVGNKVPIFDGTNMVVTTFPDIGVQCLLSDTLTNPASIGPSKTNDWYIWLDGPTVRLSHGPDWTSDTTRSAGTALVMVNGILLNNATIGNGTTTGPAARRGTYVGTTRSNASSQLDWIYGTSAAGGSSSWFGVWNCYNRVLVANSEYDTTASWTYGGGSGIRPLNGAVAGGSAGLNHRYSAVFGLQEEAAILDLIISLAHSAVANQAVAGIGMDVTNAFDFYLGSGNTAMGPTHITGVYSVIGFHFFQALENATGATGTLWGNAASSRMSYQFKAWM